MKVRSAIFWVCQPVRVPCPHVGWAQRNVGFSPEAAAEALSSLRKGPTISASLWLTSFDHRHTTGLGSLSRSFVGFDKVNVGGGV
jgi:hypothetical protein